MSRKNTLLILSLFALLLLWGCGGEEVPSPVVVSPKKNPVLSTAKVEKKEEKKEPPYSYKAEGRRDPFKSLLLGRAAQEREGEKEAVKIVGPLQNYDLENLKLVGIVWGELGNFAVIEAPDGKGYTAYLNTPIGKHNGRIKEITANKIVISESYTDIRGEKKDREMLMELRKEEG